MEVERTYRVVGVRDDGSRRILIGNLSRQSAGEVVQQLEAEHIFWMLKIEAEPGYGRVASPAESCVGSTQ